MYTTPSTLFWWQCEDCGKDYDFESVELEEDQVCECGGYLAIEWGRS